MNLHRAGEKSRSDLRVAFGPELAEWGSWLWVGNDTERSLSKRFATTRFGCDFDGMAEADVLCVIKHPLPDAVLRSLAPTTAIVYAPIDYYGSAAEIEEDREWLHHCDRIVIHSQNLRKYFSSHTVVEYLDHHVKYVAERPIDYRTEGPILWVGVRSNLPPLLEWLQQHELARRLVVLTNADAETAAQIEAALGSGWQQRLQLEVWSPERHQYWLTQASAALDIKGSDFRSRHKPPAKAIDFLASGLPLAMNASSTTDHMAAMGFEVAGPEDTDRLLSDEYWQETRRFGAALRELLSLDRVAFRWQRVIESVADERHFSPHHLTSATPKAEEVSYV